MAKIFTITHSGTKRLAVETRDGRFLDLADSLPRFGAKPDLIPRDMLDLLLNYPELEDSIYQLARSTESSGLKTYGKKEVKIEAPIARPPKIMAIAFNNGSSERFRYRYERTGGPGWFLKSPTCVVGQDDTVELPPEGWSNVTTPEIELGIVIGKKARWIQSREEAFGAIAGYTIVNDVSAQDLLVGISSQITPERFFGRKIIPDPGDQWEKDQLAGTNRIEMKQWDTFAPMGPCVVTKDEIPEPQEVNFSVAINGKIVMEGNKIELIWDVHKMLSMFSRIMTLEPGDILSSGNLGRLSPTVVLKPGDTMELTIDKIGTLRNRCARSTYPPIW